MTRCLPDAITIRNSRLHERHVNDGYLERKRGKA